MKLILAILLTIFSNQLMYAQDQADINVALKQIRYKDIKRHTTLLSSDKFQGRLPDTKGEKLTTEYLTNELKKLNIQPGNSDGTYMQKVDLSYFKISATISIKSKDKEVQLKTPVNAIVSTYSSVPSNEITTTELVFIGLGKKLKKLDLTDKFVIYIPASWESVSPTLDTLKNKGAKGVLLVNSDLLNTSFGVLRSEVYSRKAISTIPEGNSILKIYITEDVASDLFKITDHSYTDEKNKMSNQSFEPFELHANVTCKMEKEYSNHSSYNVIGKINGTDAELKNEYIVYTAHWDHLGTDPYLKNDSIYNGAIDNAGGVATLLSVAKAFKKVKLNRSLLVIFTTAEEMGMLGAKYFVENPVVPLKNIVANVNLDWFFPYGATKDVIIMGMGCNTIEDIALKAANYQGRYLQKDPHPEENFYLRSDHYPFARKGIPSLFAGYGEDHWTKGKEYIKKLIELYEQKNYHLQSDEVQSSWDWKGTEMDADFYFLVGYYLSNSTDKPTWKDSCAYPEFKSKWIELQKNN